MLASIMAIFFGAAMAPLLYRKSSGAVIAFLLALVLAVVIYFASFLHPVVNGGVFYKSVSWSPTVDVNLSFYLDGLSLFFALLITALGFLIILYSFKYMKEYEHQGRFYAYLLMFMGSMVGVVLSANLITLYLFWELTSVSSFLLIGFKNKDNKSIAAARQALIVTVAGGLALLAGVIILNIITGIQFELPRLLSGAETVQPGGLTTAAIILILIGACTKSAQVPFHFWLPNAMEAPTPVSAYLHSATMVKAGVYLIFRMNPVFADIELWSVALTIVGAATMTWAAFKALQADDLKRILAFTTISALGIFFMMGGWGSKEAINAAILYVLAHALYKGALFLAAGSIDHETGTRKISELSDLGKKMPFTAGAVVLASLSMAGVIPFIGFIGKESLYQALHESHQELSWLALALLILASVFFVAVAVDISYNVFFKKGRLREKNIHETPWTMYLPPLLLAVAGLAAGLIPSLSVEPLLKTAAENIAGAATHMKLKLWHGFNLVFILSVLTIVAGAGVYFARTRIRRWWQKIKNPERDVASVAYYKITDGMENLARFQTKALQNGYLRNYIAAIVGVFSFLILYVYFRHELGAMLASAMTNLWQGLQVYEAAVFILIVIALAILFTTTSRLIVTVTYGIIGYSLALAYTLYSAPDVAITQFLAETLTLIMLILIIHRLPPYTITKYIVKKKYLFISVFFGLLMTLISFLLMNQQVDSKLKRFFLEKSVPEGKGENVVNVILVDFRALDTLGEITVLAITMLGIIALLKINPKEKQI